jgi:phosphatidylserine decarboxylase
MAPYARLEVALTLLIGGIVTAACGYWLGWWALAPAVLTLALLSFYRDPARRPPTEANLILAPADGKIVEIARDVVNVDSPPVLRIMIFLSVFNVHINRSPCAGTVRTVTYKPGQFLNALSAEANTRNESNTLVIDPVAPLPGPVRVRQIAGVLARRIVCAVHNGAHLTAGQRFGMIKLGSRTEVCVPEHPAWEICAAVGQHVKGGLTVLALLRPEAVGRNAP